jgi:hypothetical protein
MYERSEQMGLNEKATRGRLYPESFTNASDFIGKGLLPLECTDMFDDTIGKHDIKCPVFIIKAATIAHHRFHATFTLQTR